MDLKEAITIAKKEVTNPQAKAYLNAIPEAIEEYGSHGFNVQLLYVLANLQTWRGDNARNAKIAMKAYLKSKKMI